MEEDLDRYILGENDEQISLDERMATRRIATHMLRQARRSFLLLSHDLDPTLYDDADFLEALKDLALRSPRTEVRLLVRDPGKVVHNGHRLVELMRRLSSHISIYRVHDDFQKRADSFMIVDDIGLMRRPVAERFEGVANFNDPGEAGQLRAVFERIWEMSRPDPELRRLYL